jgi:two-component sensor histidine kinase
MRRQAQEQMAASLKEKETLLLEIHHRVKNNLQVIASLVTLQSSVVQDPSALQALRETQSRIRAMSLIHAKLYQSRNMAEVDFGAFVRDLGVVLLRAYLADPSRVTLEVRRSGLRLPMDSVTPCGLIVNELLVNCVRHAFPDGRPGRVRVDIALENGLYRLRVADNGVGFPAHLDFRNTASLGLQLVNLLAEQLNGGVEMACHAGTEFTITFPAPDRPANSAPSSPPT